MTALELRRISLCYGDFQALKNIDLALNQSEIHAIVGEHGAGKSSICRIIGGFQRQSSGKIFLAGKEHDYLTPAEAMKNGIEIVQQANPAFEDFTVAKNILMRQDVFLPALFTINRINKKASMYMEELGFEIDVRCALKNLNLSDKVLVDILKHIYPKPKVLILDEALEKLASDTLQKVVATIRRMKSEGCAVLYVTHRVDDLYGFADRVTILRGGEIIMTDSIENIDKISLVRLAYTQFMRGEKSKDNNRAFYQLLKYNEAVLRKLPIRLLVVDENHRVRMINDAAMKFFTIGYGEYYNLPLDQLFTEENRRISGLIKQTISNSREERFFQVSLTVGGKKTVNNIGVSPVFDGSMIIGALISIEDITEQESLRHQMLLSEKLSSVGLLAAGVAHEINNPLEIISNNVQYIRFHEKNSEVLEVLEDMDQEVASISQIVSNLITFSGSKNTTSELVDVNEVLQHLIRLIKHNAQYKNIGIEFSSSLEHGYVLANKTEVKQAFLNVMKNSFEAMPQGGRLLVSTTSSPTIEYRQIRIQFKDSGSGIDEETLQSVLLPFYSTRRRLTNNMGLGLSISYGILKKYGGDITITNLEDPEHGCLVTINLPASGEDEMTGQQDLAE